MVRIIQAVLVLRWEKLKLRDTNRLAVDRKSDNKFPTFQDQWGI